MAIYPWITFKLNFIKNPLKSKIWMQLGECCSKCEHIANVPTNPKVVEEMHKVYLTKGVHATTAIEGNTLTEEQVRQKIDGKLQLPPSKQYLGQEVENIITICNEVMKKIGSGKGIKITIEELERYNATILKDVPVEESVTIGKLRNLNVGVGTYKAPESKDVNELLEKYCDWLNSDYFDMYPDTPIANSIIKAIMAHLYMAWIHPFGDGNGRLARILEYMILLDSGVPSPATNLLSNHYNATRIVYYQKLDSAGKYKDPSIFIEYAIQGFLDGLKEHLEYIYAHIYQISWESYVYEKFRDSKQHDTTNKRRRTLVLEISKSLFESVKEEEIMSKNHYLFNAYRKKTELTLKRDLKETINMGLIEKTEQGYKANVEKIFIFLPFRKTHQ
ncbi:MAG: Fic family protein [Candidatus Aureabacteria bacterium]|nr:Fic family protein [Candidatus Auribacterota bacterium]